ncbi:MAG: 30S ribosomal protein S19e [Candidatus Heimdallarchaeaceae archaeon]|jgi:small subunit ribosomal protein S19e
MPTAYDVPADLLINKIAEELKKETEIKPPEWAVYAKTGVHKESSPDQEDWWYIRAASILRKIYFYGPIGVSRLRIAYGGRRRRGVKPEHFARGSGAVIRKILQQLEKSEYIQKKEGHGAKGRVIIGRVVSPKGHSFIDKSAAEIKRLIPELEIY